MLRTGCHTWASSRPVSVCWHSDTVWALFCCVGRLEEDLCGGTGCKWRTVMGPVVSEEPWLNMDRHTLCCITIAGECNSWLYPQPSPWAPNPISPAPSQTLRLFAALQSLFSCVYTIISGSSFDHLCPVENNSLLHWLFLAFISSTVKRSQILDHLASAVVSNGSTDINMAQLISKCLGRKG